jgi:hypothetical protein
VADKLLCPRAVLIVLYFHMNIYDSTAVYWYTGSFGIRASFCQQIVLQLKFEGHSFTLFFSFSSSVVPNNYEAVVPNNYETCLVCRDYV